MPMTKQSGTLHTLRFRFDDGITFPITALKLLPVDTRERIAAELVPLRIGDQPLRFSAIILMRSRYRSTI